MIKAHLKVGEEANIIQLCQKKDGNYYKVNQPNIGTIYISKIFIKI